MKITGWTEEQIDLAGAERCDWLLLVDAMDRAVAEKRQYKILQAMTARR